MQIMWKMRVASYFMAILSLIMGVSGCSSAKITDTSILGDWIALTDDYKSKSGDMQIQDDSILFSSPSFL